MKMIERIVSAAVQWKRLKFYQNFEKQVCNADKVSRIEFITTMTIGLKGFEFITVQWILLFCAFHENTNMNYYYRCLNHPVCFQAAKVCHTTKMLFLYLPLLWWWWWLLMTMMMIMMIVNDDDDDHDDDYDDHDDDYDDHLRVLPEMAGACWSPPSSMSSMNLLRKPSTLFSIQYVMSQCHHHCHCIKILWKTKYIHDMTFVTSSTGSATSVEYFWIWK